MKQLERLYPLELIPGWLVVLGVIILTALALWVGSKENSARTLGLVAVPISLATGWCWFTGLPQWTAWVTFAVTLVLFSLGMIELKRRTSVWHYAAYVFALFGKLLLWTIPLTLWNILSGKVPIHFSFTLQGWMIIILLLGIGIGAGAMLSDSFRNKLKHRLSTRTTNRSPAPTT